VCKKKNWVLIEQDVDCGAVLVCVCERERE
jgi:hypothetical protein